MQNDLGSRRDLRKVDVHRAAREPDVGAEGRLLALGNVEKGVARAGDRKDQRIAAGIGQRCFKSVMDSRWIARIETGAAKREGKLLVGSRDEKRPRQRDAIGIALAEDRLAIARGYGA